MSEANDLNVFNKLPPEMVTGILERLESSADAFLSCRLVCSRFKYVVDEILEKRLWSLWDWTSSHAENDSYSPRPVYIPIRRPVLCGKLFQGIADVDVASLLTNFPCRGIHFWGLEKDEVIEHSFEQLSLIDDPKEEKIRHISYLEKSVSLLQQCGNHLTSLIIESPAQCLLSRLTSQQTNLEDFALILGATPNLKYIMLKRIFAEDREKSEISLPALEYLESIKLIECNDVIVNAMVSHYQSQVQTLQLVRNRYQWFQHFVSMQGIHQGQIFGELRELKLGNFDYSSQFDFLAICLRTQTRMGRPWTKLERLQLDYSIATHYKFYKPIEIIFQVLQFLPKLKELHVGNSGSSEFEFDQDGKNLKEILSKICSSESLTRIALPVEFIQYPVLMRNVFREKLRNLQQVTFQDFNRRLWSRVVEPENVLKLPRGKTLRMVVMDLMDMQGFSSLINIQVVSRFENEEREICSVYQ